MSGFSHARWDPQLADLAARFRVAEPFPHVHLTDFLDLEVVRQGARDFPSPRSGPWITYRHYNERKLGQSRREAFPASLGALVDELCAPGFVRWLSALTGIPDLLADPVLDGGGLHQTERGGYLNIHADFTMHHYQRNWRRRLNLILFLNETWQEDWGGALELWDERIQRCVVKVPPLLNHAVIFETTATSFHGYADPLACPPGTTRKSIALYYYAPGAAERRAARATNYRARPGDGARALGIWCDKTMVALYSRAKSRLGLSDDLASRLHRLAHLGGRPSSRPPAPRTTSS
jgi:hypothetical protein